MENEIVVLLPTEFYSEHGVVVQLEKVMAALAVHGIKYERHLAPPRVSLRDGVSALTKVSGDYDFEALSGHQQQSEQQNIPENIPGWVLVPIVPTEKMIIEGFESAPHPIFQPDDWDKYEVMSGCEKAAHRARLCWAAMINASKSEGVDK